MPKKYGVPDAENPEWTREAFRAGRRVEDVPELARILRKHRGPQRAPTKVQISLRVDRDTLAAFRAAGRGWQSRMNDALRRAASRQSKGSAA
jgi:uncharacterized protein (DUF4415 family)